MRFISALVAGALAAVAVAQTTGNEPNPFTNSDYSGIAAGTPITLTWTPTTDGTVTIELVQGDPGHLNPVSIIQSEFASLALLNPFPSRLIIPTTYFLPTTLCGFFFWRRNYIWEDYEDEQRF